MVSAKRNWGSARYECRIATPLASRICKRVGQCQRSNKFGCQMWIPGLIAHRVGELPGRASVHELAIGRSSGSISLKVPLYLLPKDQRHIASGFLQKLFAAYADLGTQLQTLQQVN